MIKKILKLSLVGKTNAGKSTFINNIVGETVSIQNKKINTTQELIIGVKNLDNSQFIFYDTPGLSNLKSLDKNKKKLKINLWEGINQSDIILYIIDSKNFKITYIHEQLIKLLELDKKIIIIFNKVDLISKSILLPIIKELNNTYNLEAFFVISAKLKYGIEDLIKFLKKYAKESKWIFHKNVISNKDDIFISNECTRNSILTFLHKEIPYNIKIKNIIFKYLKNGDLKIKQKIIIDQNRYKKIILGKKGEKIKSIREYSQKEIEKIFKVNTHLYLEIIKVNAKKN